MKTSKNDPCHQDLASPAMKTIETLLLLTILLFAVPADGALLVTFREVPGTSIVEFELSGEASPGFSGSALNVHSSAFQGFDPFGSALPSEFGDYFAITTGTAIIINATTNQSRSISGIALLNLAAGDRVGFRYSPAESLFFEPDDILTWIGFGTIDLAELGASFDDLVIGSGSAKFSSVPWSEAEVILEIVSAPEPVFNITKVEYSRVNGMLTLTWDSSPGSRYAITYSRDMTNWDADLDDGIGADQDENPDDGDRITKTFDLTQTDIEDAGRLFFRVEER